MVVCFEKRAGEDMFESNRNDKPVEKTREFGALSFVRSWCRIIKKVLV